jgi:hypothetical protein
MMRKKQVEVEHLEAGDPRLGGATGRTVLHPDGIRVLLAPGPTRATLTEELVHVNQLRRLARRAGGFEAVFRELSAETAAARLVPLSMEAYAQGRVSSTLTGADRARARAARDAYRRELGKAGVRSERARTLWNQGGGAVPTPGRGRAAR